MKSRISILPVAVLLFVSLACRPETVPKRFHLINLSLPKTGSLSLTAIFGRYRSSHDYLLQETVSRYLDWRQGQFALADVQKFLRYRDQLGNFEVDSATFHYLAMEQVMSTFPEAKFYVSIRNGADWIVSLTEMLHNFYGPGQFLEKHGIDKKFVLRYFSHILPGFSPDAFSEIRKFNVSLRHILPVMAELWGRTSLAQLQLVKSLPRERILLVKTEDISHSLTKMAQFAGVPVDTLDSSRTHMHKDFRAAAIRDHIGTEALEKAVRPWQMRVDAALKELADR